MNSDTKQAIQLLKNDDVVALPTETVYGLAARIDSEIGIKKIFSVKGRPFFDPLIVHVSSIDQAKTCTTDWNEAAQALAETFWPGPLTLVLPKSKAISDLITAGLPSVGLRWPKHPFTESVINELGIPLAAPSANKFGRTSPTTASHVRDEFGDAVYVVPAEDCKIGIESTVLLIKQQSQKFQLSILRRGFVLQSQINQILQAKGILFVWIETVDKKESPGHTKHHYMPSIPFVICRNSKLKLSELQALLNLKLHELPDEVEGVKIIKPLRAISKIEFLQLDADPNQAARLVYAQLRSASQRKPDVLCLIQTEKHKGELWESIFDRLNKAASLIIDD